MDISQRSVFLVPITHVHKIRIVGIHGLKGVGVRLVGTIEMESGNPGVSVH